MTTHYGKPEQPTIGGCVISAGDRVYARWGAVNTSGDQVDCVKCLAFRQIIPTDSFIASVQRMHRALETRAIDDPAHLIQMIMLAEALSASVNVVIATSTARYDMDKRSAPSAGEIAGLLGMTKQGVSDRRKRGDRELFERQMNAVPMARREKLARINAQKHADELLASWIERRENAV